MSDKSATNNIVWSQITLSKFGIYLVCPLEDLGFWAVVHFFPGWLVIQSNSTRTNSIASPLDLVLKIWQEVVRRVPCSQTASFRPEESSAGERQRRRWLRWQILQTRSEGEPIPKKLSPSPVLRQTQQCELRQEVRIIKLSTSNRLSENSNIQAEVSKSFFSCFVHFLFFC